MSRYVLPDLPYDYGALEPHLSGRIMQLHHDKHHRKYVDTANECIEKLLEARSSGAFDGIPALEHKLAFNLSGHVLHSLFWQNLAPRAGGEPDGPLAQAIARDFGGFAGFKKQLVTTASTIMGSGWAALVWDPVIQRLGTSQIHDHQSEVTQASFPLLVLDAWEHAYYLQYQADKEKYFEAIWNLWNWHDVARRFAAAQRIDVGLEGAAERPDRGAPAPLH
ncbi:MAG TPA: superoxide dismutase [Myxococcales bacterium]|nr:superoxide dismutase [Myxococcales bacterium]